MSVIWSISKDVLVATWSIPSKRLIAIAFRLSIIIGVIMTFVSLYQMYERYDAVVRDHARIHVALQCAQGHSDQTLLQYANQFGNIDISKVYCADRVFWASLAEIRGVPKNFDPQVNYLHYIDPLWAAGEGFGLMIGVNLLASLIIGVRRIAAWVIGTEPV